MTRCRATRSRPCRTGRRARGCTRTRPATPTRTPCWALGRVLAAKATMEKFNIPGTLKFFGEPAEKVCGSKPVHAAKGYFDDADAFISYHPLNANTCVWETHCGSYWSAVFTFECADPEAWEVKGISPTAQADPSAANPHS